MELVACCPVAVLAGVLMGCQRSEVGGSGGGAEGGAVRVEVRRRIQKSTSCGACQVARVAEVVSVKKCGSTRGGLREREVVLAVDKAPGVSILRARFSQNLRVTGQVFIVRQEAGLGRVAVTGGVRQRGAGRAERAW